ncbi:MAG TPA: FAD-binding oxidoreductase [Candidatus Saccharimonadales bacterium]|nr:FAD-binding oxidoreductase [Candidatus Saccharimonadales bacterium]
MDKTLETFIETLAGQVHGRVITAKDTADYEKSRQVLFNHKAHPAVIVECADEADVAATIEFATKHDLKLSVRSGGHSGLGFGTNDDGVVIDLSRMNDIKIIDGANHIVRLGAGAHWGTVAKELAPHNLAISSGDTTSVGVGGLTLGAGVGWMVREFGLAIDSVVAFDVVDADGKTLRATADENPDLFWALRGGGGNFGVVTAIEFRAHQSDGIFGGTITYGVDKREEVLTNWAEYMRTATPELNSTFMLAPGFGPGQSPSVMVLVCYAGSDETKAQAAIQPLRELGDTPTSDDVKAKPYYEMLEEAMPVGDMVIRVRNGFVKSLNDDVIKTIAENFGTPGKPFLQIRAVGGAMNDVPADATAFAHRDAEAFMLMPTFGPAGSTDEAVNQDADKLWAPLKRFVHGAYVNFLTDTHKESINQVYPPQTLARLRKVKAEYDPANVFHRNVNIKPE